MGTVDGKASAGSGDEKCRIEGVEGKRNIASLVDCDLERNPRGVQIQIESLHI